jgi:hypothetical protein
MRYGGNTMQHFTTPVTLVAFEGSNGQPPQKSTSVRFGSHTQSGRIETPANVWAEALSPLAPPKLEYVPGSTVRAQRYSPLNLSYRLLAGEDSATRPTPILDKMRVNFDTAVACPFHRGTGSAPSQSSIWAPRRTRISESLIIAPKMLAFQVVRADMG